jgi:hypothetical protein
MTKRYEMAWKKALGLSTKVINYADEIAGMGEAKMSMALKMLCRAMTEALELEGRDSLEEAWLYAHQIEYWLVLFVFAHRIGFSITSVLLDEIADVKHLLFGLVRFRKQEANQ